ncbi:MAG: NAD(P)H-dependent oxidoreductase [Gammaproteobacteria bacterium]|nr:NAD(P)H-dependent oxidoreductase [Gammaproteobacteria bacterium]MCP5197855.1 NAD(P)H-dependent oxidoreductase [Gammaproteobacteria bacterium]
MKTLLQLNTSLFSGQGQSTQLADQFVALWRDKNPDSRVVKRDLAADPVPHLDGARFQSFLAAPESRSEEQHIVVAYSDALIEELRAADIVVLGLPMYNFGIPSTLKAYFDHIARAGTTFKYTEKGPVGLLSDKIVVVYAARGGRYAGTPLDTQTDYVRNFLHFIGIDDVRFIYAEGLALGEDSKSTSLAQARSDTETLVA